jgi:sugar O-acyltransferase (sialic acid O-acetyltransferase NeuD family)
LWILGTSGHSLEVEAIVRATGLPSDQWDSISRIDSGQEELLMAEGGDAVLGMGTPSVRRSAMQRLRPYVEWPRFIHPSASIGPDNELHAGVVIAVGAAITTRVQMREGSMLGTNSIISHGSVVGRYSLINPNATISGDVRIGDAVLIGAGAVVLEGREVGDDAIVGAGAVVTRDVKAGETVIGIPAKPTLRHEYT